MKFKLLLFFTLFCMAASAQNLVNITPFSMPRSVPANTAEWGNLPSLIIVANAAGQGNLTELEESKVAFTIKSGGNKVCGGNLVQSGFSGRNKVFKASEISGMLNGCVLKPGSYQLCVQFFSSANGQTKPISDEKCSNIDFVIDAGAAVTTPANTNFTPPQNIAPANQKVLNEAETRQPLTFRWTPLVPKPRTPVIYNLKVWQVLDGQNAAQVMKSNQPFIEEEVKDQTQYAYRKGWDGVVKGGSKIAFVWRVEAVDEKGKPYGSSEPTAFSVGSPCSPDYEMFFDSVYCGADGKVHVQGHIKLTPKPTITINSISLTQIKETNFSGANVPTSITLPKLLTGSGGNYPFNFIINEEMCGKTLFLGYSINFTCSSTGITMDLPCAETYSNVPCCVCTSCDEKNFSLTANPPSISIAGNFIDYNQPITVTTTPTRTIKSIKAELIYFEMVPENDYCIPCNKESATYAHFSNNSNSMQWNKEEKRFAIKIAIPPLTPCCSAVFKWCVRYKIEFTDCTTCNKVVCYEKKKAGCEQQQATSTK